MPKRFIGQSVQRTENRRSKDLTLRRKFMCVCETSVCTSFGLY